MAQVLLCAGAKGKRYALPHSRIMMHQPSGGSQGTLADIEIYTQFMIGVLNQLYGIIAKHTEKDFDTINNDADRDKWMTSSEAQEYGIIDKVMKRSENI
jgi:ATP-dependent Clp protease protease subunit